MPDTLAAQLASVRAAIQAVETNGQAADINGRSVTRANLPVLYARERDLLTRIARRRRGGPRVYQIIPGE